MSAGSGALRKNHSGVNSYYLLADFEHYFHRFTLHISGTIVDYFKFSDQLTTLAKADAIGAALDNFVNPEPLLSWSSIDDYSMGIASEKVIRKFNFKNNKEP